MASDSVQVIQYLVDTRPLWPKATKTKDLENEAARALALLTDEEKTKVLRYYFVADAKMSLTSHLLKHWVVARYANVPWWDTKLTRDDKTKPVYVDPTTGKQPVAFNVSHQAGLVALVAVAGYSTTKENGETGKGEEVNIGTDIVCTSERRTRDHRVIDTEGWGKFVDMHADVFGRGEARYLKGDLLSTQPGLPSLARGDEITDFKLRCFYTLWCLREAYVKMTGDALLAPWLRDLEFRRFRAPVGGLEFGQVREEEEGREGEVVMDQEVWFRGERVVDARIVMRSLGEDYMTCTAVRTPVRKEDALGWKVGPFEFLEMETVLGDAEARLG
ncbi:phosphopantetheinyl transferase [Annulohypoxylon maeteangense]|uniref:phosphopantetheinyl transferase n=1 Tax=Annulohypoxylon maeteangense TaxID=1927788 RepID=UPI002008B67B|nr:phosphopantetheinyl transferase [Annulohypoxylon maeteangense]KAI0886254.1 phosphopantetheinyl transferase [Annulohypoxylon maeteangense]